MSNTGCSRPFSLRLGRDGAELRADAAEPAVLAAMIAVLAKLPTDRAGVRIAGVCGLAPHLGSGGAVGGIAAAVLGPGTRPVRAVLFDKSAATNWALGWHQDRTIVVQRKVETDGYGPWTTKAGLQHVQPPMALLERMLTLRLHLDPADEDNAPLLVAPGSHKLGAVAERDVADVVAQCGTVACLAGHGDVWVYATPILHASESARQPRRRRVLQVDYSADDLPGELEWLGV